MKLLVLFVLSNIVYAADNLPLKGRVADDLISIVWHVKTRPMEGERKFNLMDEFGREEVRCVQKVDASSCIVNFEPRLTESNEAEIDVDFSGGFEADQGNLWVRLSDPRKGIWKGFDYGTIRGIAHGHFPGKVFFKMDE